MLVLLLLFTAMAAAVEALKCYSSSTNTFETCNSPRAVCARFTYFTHQFAGCLEDSLGQGGEASCSTIRFLDPTHACCCSTDLCNANDHCQISFPSSSSSVRLDATSYMAVGLIFFSISIVCLLVYSNFYHLSSSNALLQQQQQPSFRKKPAEGESPAPPTSPKTIVAPQRRRSRASSDLSGFELPLPPPLSATANSATRTSRYISMLVNGLASPFTNHHRRGNREETLRSNNDILLNKEEEDEDDKGSFQVPKFQLGAFAGHEFDEPPLSPPSADDYV